MESLELPPPSRPPPPPPPKRLSRPKITLQMPDAMSPVSLKGPPSSAVRWGPQVYPSMGPPGTAATHISDPSVNPYYNPFLHMYPTKATEFMLKGFAGFKDFTMNTARSGLSVGEKSALWFYHKLSTLSKRWFTHLFLMLCLVVYSLIGGAMFMALEGRNEQKTTFDKELVDARKEFTSRLQKAFNEDITLLKGNDSAVVLKLESDLINYETNSHNIYKKHENENGTQVITWNFLNSMFYAGTIFTTIGYGHISPKTTMGRVATIVYAIVGIPLFLIVLADFGKLFTRIIKFFWAYIRRFYYTRSCKKVRRTVQVQEVMRGLNMVYGVVRRPSQIFNGEAAELPSHEPPPVERRSSDVPPPLPPKPNTPRDFEIRTEPETPAPSVFEIDDEFNLPISLAIIILIIYLVIGAVGYSMVEEWSVFESFYFVFISMSTIGLGDYVPSNPIFMMASIIYLVFGLALTSMCINVVQLKLSDTFMKASAKLGATIGLKVAEEDGSLVPCTPPPAELVPVHKPKSEVIDTEKVETDKSETKNT